jgi:hypothetical protein
VIKGSLAFTELLYEFLSLDLIFILCQIQLQMIARTKYVIKTVTNKNELCTHIYIVTYTMSVWGSVTTWIRIGYRIYSLWRFQLQQITIIINT